MNDEEPIDELKRLVKTLIEEQRKTLAAAQAAAATSKEAAARSKAVDSLIRMVEDSLKAEIEGLRVLIVEQVSDLTGRIESVIENQNRHGLRIRELEGKSVDELVRAEVERREKTAQTGQ
jgi:hypothetical protein